MALSANGLECKARLRNIHYTPGMKLQWHAPLWVSLGEKTVWGMRKGEGEQEEGEQEEGQNIGCGLGYEHY